MSVERKQVDASLKRVGNMIGVIDRDSFKRNISDQQLMVRIQLAQNSLDALMNRRLDEDQRSVFMRYKYHLVELEKSIRKRGSRVGD